MQTRLVEQDDHLLLEVVEHPVDCLESRLLVQNDLPVEGQFEDWNVELGDREEPEVVGLGLVEDGSQQVYARHSPFLVIVCAVLQF